MRCILVALTPQDLAELGDFLGLLPACPGARPSPGAYLRALLRQALREQQQQRRQQLHRLLQAYWPVGRAVATRYFRRLRGAVPLAELDSAAWSEMAKAALKFRPSLGYSPAPYFRCWAEHGVRAYLRERQEQERRELVRPDQEEAGERSRWERLGGEDHGLAAADERRAVRQAVQAWLRGLPPGLRPAAERLLQEGQGPAELREALRAELQRHGVEHQGGELITLREAQRRYGVPAKALLKRIGAGQLEGRRDGPSWLCWAEDARALARARARPW